MKPLRILIVTDHYPPFIGGAHRQSYLLGQKLTALGHDVRVATVWHMGLPRLQNDNGVQVRRFKQLVTWVPWASKSKRQRHHPPFPDPVTVIGLRRLITAFKPDVIHAHGWITYSCAAALIGNKAPLLITARDYGYSCATRTLLYRDQTCSGPALGKCLECSSRFYGKSKGWLAVFGVLGARPLLRRKVSAIHSISTFVQKITEQALLTERTRRQAIPDVIIPSFLDANDDSETLSTEHVKGLPETPFILFVGALQRRKGINELLAAYTHLSTPPPLVLIGTVELDTPTSFPPGVILLQNFPHGSVMAAWERCSFGVVPSLWPEPLGAVVFEAMSRGKAVIGTTPGGHADMIIDSKTGFLVPAGDVDRLTEAMQKLIDNPTMREQFGCAGRERIKLFTADTVLPRFEALYEQIVNGPTKQG